MEKDVFMNGTEKGTTEDVNCACAAETCEAPIKAGKIKGEGQVNLFGEVENSKKKPKKKQASNKKKPTFKETRKRRIIYAGREIEIAPEHAYLEEKEIWDIYLKDNFPEFRAGKEYVVFSLGEKDQEGVVFPRPKAYKMG